MKNNLPADTSPAPAPGFLIRLALRDGLRLPIRIIFEVSRRGSAREKSRLKIRCVVSAASEFIAGTAD
jgi:hypothetical protein